MVPSANDPTRSRSKLEVQLELEPRSLSHGPSHRERDGPNQFEELSHCQSLTPSCQ